MKRPPLLFLSDVHCSGASLEDLQTEAEQVSSYLKEVLAELRSSHEALQNVDQSDMVDYALGKIPAICSIIDRVREVGNDLEKYRPAPGHKCSLGKDCPVK